MLAFVGVIAVAFGLGVGVGSVATVLLGESKLKSVLLFTDCIIISYTDGSLTANGSIEIGIEDDKIIANSSLNLRRRRTA